MNTSNKGLLIFIGLVLAVGFVIALQLMQPAPTTEEYVVDASDMLVAQELLTPEETAGTGGLTQEEIAGLLLMREEEKLARDVYTVLGEQWDLRIFSNIAASEQTHMDAMKALLEFYDIADPITDDTIGVFTDATLQTLYESLTQKGGESRLGALIVGATIEDLDIYDLERLIDQTARENIVTTYSNLQKGSRNHLRAFNRQIERNDGRYEPQYISAQWFQDIVQSDPERGVIQ